MLLKGIYFGWGGRKRALETPWVALPPKGRDWNPWKEGPASSLGSTKVRDDLCECVNSEKSSCSLSGMRRLLPFWKTSAFPLAGIYLHSSKSSHLWALCKTAMREEWLQTSHRGVTMSGSCLWLGLDFGVLGAHPWWGWSPSLGYIFDGEVCGIQSSLYVKINDFFPKVRLLVRIHLSNAMSCDWECCSAAQSVGLVYNRLHAACVVSSSMNYAVTCLLKLFLFPLL